MRPFYSVKFDFTLEALRYSCDVQNKSVRLYSIEPSRRAESTRRYNHMTLIFIIGVVLLRPGGSGGEVRR